MTNNFKFFDSHSDFLHDVLLQREKGNSNVVMKRHYPLWQKGGLKTVIAAIFLDDNYLPKALQTALNMIANLYIEIEESGGKLALCKNCKDIQNAHAKGQIAIILGLEGAEPFEDNINLVNIFYELGVRFLGLCWARKNLVCEGAPLMENGKNGGGLTAFGKDVIKRAQELGMVIDLAHINEKGFWEALDIIDKPFIISHANCRALANTPRNLTDEQLKAIAKKGGVLGINDVSLMVDLDPKKATIGRMAEHVVYAVKIMGANHVGFGLDFFEYLIDETTSEKIKALPNPPFDVLKDHSEVPKLVEILQNAGLSEEDLNKICYENFARIVAKM